MIITENNNNLLFFFPFLWYLFAFSYLMFKVSRILFNNKNENRYISMVSPLVLMLAIVVKILKLFQV